MDGRLGHRPQDRVVRRDLAAGPPPLVTEAWVAASFTAPEQRDAAMRVTLAWFDASLPELEAAGFVANGRLRTTTTARPTLGGLVRRVIGVGRAFFDLERGDWPLAPTMAGKRLVVLSAR